MIAMALANNPDVLIADEPTTALDVTVQARILELLADLQKRLGMSIVFITHDLGIVRRFADRTYVMKQRRGGGKRRDRRTSSPRRSIPTPACCIDAEPRGRKEPPPADAPIVLEAKNIEVELHARAAASSTQRATCCAPSTASASRCAPARPSASSANPARASRRSGAPSCACMPASGLIRFEDRNLMPLDRAACGRCAASCSSSSRTRSAPSRRA